MNFCSRICGLADGGDGDPVAGGGRLQGTASRVSPVIPGPGFGDFCNTWKIWTRCAGDGQARIEAREATWSPRKPKSKGKTIIVIIKKREKIKKKKEKEK